MFGWGNIVCPFLHEARLTDRCDSVSGSQGEYTTLSSPEPEPNSEWVRQGIKLGLRGER